MKKLLAVLLTTVLFYTANAQQGNNNVAHKHRAYIDSLLSTVAIGRNDIATGILYDRAVTIASLQGFQQSHRVSKGYFMQSALELRNASYDTLLLPTTENLRSIAEHYEYRRNQIPMGILYSTFTHIDTLAVEKGYIVIDGKGNPRPTGRLKREGLQEKEVLMASLLADKREVSQQVSFVLPKELIIGNSANKISHIEVDFGDGQGFRTIEPNAVFDVSYSYNKQPNCYKNFSKVYRIPLKQTT